MISSSQITGELRREQSSVEVLEGVQNRLNRNHKKTLRENGNLLLFVAMERAQNKQNQTSGEETATEESQKRDACDDPNTDNTETETASVEHKNQILQYYIYFCI